MRRSAVEMVGVAGPEPQRWWPLRCGPPSDVQDYYLVHDTLQHDTLKHDTLKHDMKVVESVLSTLQAVVALLHSTIFIDGQTLTQAIYIMDQKAAASRRWSDDRAARVFKQASTQHRARGYSSSQHVHCYPV